MMAAIFFCCTPCRADLTLQQGESYVWQFQSMNPRTGSAPWLIQFGTEPLSSGETAQISFFENALTELPILQRTIPGPLNGFIFFGPENEGHFQDFQGVVKVEALTGSFGVRSLSVGTQVGGQNYIASVLPTVPEPGAGSLLAGGFGLLAMSRRSRASLPS